MLSFFHVGIFMAERRDSIYSRRVIATIIDDPMKQVIISSEVGTDALKKYVNKLAQQANRRIQNVTSKGLASPAVKAVLAERGQKGYTVFSTAGLNPSNKADWEMIKYEYGRLVSFLSNPTSTATGARQYIKYNADSMGIPFESANRIIDMATSPQIDESGNVNIFNYGATLEHFRNDVFTVQREMSRDSEQYAQELEAELQRAIKVLSTEQELIYQSYLRKFHR